MNSLQHNQLIGSLHGLRGIAALTVVIGHSREFTGIPLPDMAAAMGVFLQPCYVPALEKQLKDLIEQEKALHQFENRQNRVLLEKLIHSDFHEIGRTGVSYVFESIIDMMLTEKSSSLIVHSQNYKCVELDTTVQLLLYKSALVDENGLVGSYTKRCSIWALVDGLWQLKFHQGTPCESFTLAD